MLRTRFVTVPFKSLNMALIWTFVSGGGLFVGMPKPSRFAPVTMPPGKSIGDPEGDMRIPFAAPLAYADDAKPHQPCGRAAQHSLIERRDSGNNREIEQTAGQVQSRSIRDSEKKKRSVQERCPEPFGGPSGLRQR